MIHPNDESFSFIVSRNLVGSQNDSMKTKLSSMRDISQRGVLIIVDSTPDLEKLEAEMERIELTKDHSISKPERRNPEIIIFGVDPNLEREALVDALKRQNAALDGADTTPRKMLQTSCLTEEI